MKLQEQIQSISRGKNSSSPSSPPLTPSKTALKTSNPTSPKTIIERPMSTQSPRYQTSRNSTTDVSMNEDYNITASKLERFKSLLAQPDVDIDELRKLSWSGIPSEVRPLVWKILVVCFLFFFLLTK